MLTGNDPSAGPYTVADAMRDYEAAFIARGGKALQSVRSIAAGYILPVLGDIDCEKLTKPQVTAWFNGIVTTKRTCRALKDSMASRPPKRSDNAAESLRKRRSTANRILTVLKAALNHAHREQHVGSDAAWRMVKPFRSVDGVRTHFLRPHEARRLVEVCDGDFRALVQGALLTGCRYGELCRLQVRDVELQSGSIHVRESKSGKPRHVPLNEEGLELFTKLTLGKSAYALVFTREGAPWKASDQARPMRSACMAADIEADITFHSLRDTYASNLVMAGATIEVVAQLLGHSDSRITSKHYAHLAPTYISDVLRATLPRFTAVAATTEP